ncbi:neuromedin-U receptor 2-like [Asterias rubens]|uniref:neuromedin-U receptor 2-like n=1 Tax=Asterias rubens TaxID=7604 RepID=UPI001455544F|nr:neuromedin-U receptor 2-like [Asterias rubens]
MEQALVVLQYVMAVQGSVGVIGNLLVCLTIAKTKSMHNVTNCLLFNLASADACVSLMAFLELYFGLHFRSKIGIFGYCTPSFIFNFNSHFMYGYFVKSLYTCSILSLTLATFERYIGIIHPFQHSSFLTRRKIISMLCSTWVLPLLYELPTTIAFIILYVSDNCTIPTYDKYPGLLVLEVVRTFATFVLPCIVLAFMYIKILVNLKSGARHLEEQGVQGPPQELYRAHKKVTQALSFVVAAFFILILPGQMLRLLIIYTNYFGGNYDLSECLSKINSILISCNSVINPIVYGFKYTQLRRACIAVLCPCSTRCNRSNQVQQHVPGRI